MPKDKKKEKRGKVTKEPLISRKSEDASATGRQSRDGRKSLDEGPRRKSFDASSVFKKGKKKDKSEKKSTASKSPSSPASRPVRKISQPPPVLPDVPEDSYTNYELKPTDTIEGVALRFNVSVDDLTQLNGMTSGTGIYNYKLLRVPKLESKK